MYTVNTFRSSSSFCFCKLFQPIFITATLLLDILGVDLHASPSSTFPMLLDLLCGSEKSFREKSVELYTWMVVDDTTSLSPEI